MEALSKNLGKNQILNTLFAKMIKKISECFCYNLESIDQVGYQLGITMKNKKSRYQFFSILNSIQEIF